MNHFKRLLNGIVNMAIFITIISVLFGAAYSLAYMAIVIPYGIIFVCSLVFLCFAYIVGDEGDE